jgi:hypothetical protein
VGNKKKLAERKAERRSAETDAQKKQRAEDDRARKARWRAEARAALDAAADPLGVAMAVQLRAAEDTGFNLYDSRPRYDDDGLELEEMPEAQQAAVVAQIKKNAFVTPRAKERAACALSASPSNHRTGQLACGACGARNINEQRDYKTLAVVDDLGALRCCGEVVQFLAELHGRPATLRLRDGTNLLGVDLRRVYGVWDAAEGAAEGERQWYHLAPDLVRGDGDTATSVLCKACVKGVGDGKPGGPESLASGKDFGRWDRLLLKPIDDARADVAKAAAEAAKEAAAAAADAAPSQPPPPSPPSPPSSPPPPSPPAHAAVPVGTLLPPPPSAISDGGGGCGQQLHQSAAAAGGGAADAATTAAAAAAVTLTPLAPAPALALQQTPAPAAAAPESPGPPSLPPQLTPGSAEPPPSSRAPSPSEPPSSQSPSDTTASQQLQSSPDAACGSAGGAAATLPLGSSPTTPGAAISPPGPAAAALEAATKKLEMLKEALPPLTLAEEMLLAPARLYQVLVKVPFTENAPASARRSKLDSHCITFFQDALSQVVDALRAGSLLDHSKDTEHAWLDPVRNGFYDSVSVAFLGPADKRGALERRALNLSQLQARSSPDSSSRPPPGGPSSCSRPLRGLLHRGSGSIAPGLMRAGMPRRCDRSCSTTTCRSCAAYTRRSSAACPPMRRWWRCGATCLKRW